MLGKRAFTVECLWMMWMLIDRGAGPAYAGATASQGVMADVH